MARASRRMAASLSLRPWFETARIAAKCTQAAPAMARLLTMRQSVLELCTWPERRPRSSRLRFRFCFRGRRGVTPCRLEGVAELGHLHRGERDRRPALLAPGVRDRRE